MVQADRLRKRYGPNLALDGVTFQVERGDIVGFLGPNGAGKTTTMRILAGFLPASSGAAAVAGYDVARDSIEVRRRIGYLPEGVPLYPEMRAEEYLMFRARIKGLGRRDRRRRVSAVIARCGLGTVRRKTITGLSKGYRQRVGVADALVSDPPVLILDEPTIGLDPNQIREIRELIRELGGDHTVILSTHILPEVEAVCKRVLIIHRGRIAFDDMLEEVAGHGAGGTRIVIEARLPEGARPDAIADVPGVQDLSVEEDGGVTRVTVLVAPEPDIRGDLFRRAVGLGWTILELRRIKPSLEDVFVRLTAGED